MTPRNLDRMLGKRARSAPAGELLISGMLTGGDLALSFTDCLALAPEHQVRDVGTYAAGEHGQGVRLRAIYDRARVLPETMYVNVRTSDGFAVALFASEIKELGILVYAMQGQPLAAHQGGFFRLVLPGFHDERRSIEHVNALFFAAEPVPDTRVRRFARPAARNSQDAIYPPDWITPDPAHTHSGLVPKPVVHTGDEVGP